MQSISDNNSKEQLEEQVDEIQRVEVVFENPLEIEF